MEKKSKDPEKWKSLLSMNSLGQDQKRRQNLWHYCVREITVIVTNVALCHRHYYDCDCDCDCDRGNTVMVTILWQRHYCDGDNTVTDTSDLLWQRPVWRSTSRRPTSTCNSTTQRNSYCLRSSPRCLEGIVAHRIRKPPPHTPAEPTAVRSSLLSKYPRYRADSSLPANDVT